MEAQQLDPVLAARSRSALWLAIISLRVMVGTYPTQHQHQDGRDLSRDGPAQAQPRHDGRPDPLCDPQQHRGAQADIRNPNSVAIATRLDPARRVVSGAAKRGWSSTRDGDRRDPYGSSVANTWVKAPLKSALQKVRQPAAHRMLSPVPAPWVARTGLPPGSGRTRTSDPTPASQGRGCALPGRTEPL